MYGPDGKSVTKMTWESFKRYQRWDEFLERTDNPPMIADFSFWYKGKKYYCTGEDYGFIVVDDQWNRLAYNDNFLKLLEMPLFDYKSFREIIDELLICE